MPTRTWAWYPHPGRRPRLLTDMPTKTSRVACPRLRGHVCRAMSEEHARADLGMAPASWTAATAVDGEAHEDESGGMPTSSWACAPRAMREEHAHADVGMAPGPGRCPRLLTGVPA